jgi:hypothetical protein
MIAAYSATEKIISEPKAINSREDEMTATIPTLDESIERMKQEILEDIKAGRVPADCPSFAALHDYVDANEYGGFCEGALADALIEHFGGCDKNEGMPGAMLEFLNNAQNAIDLWLKNNGVAQSTGTMMKKGDVVKFKEAKDPGDAACKMVLVDNPDGGRVLVRHLVDMKIQPTSIYLTKDLQLCPLHGND